MGGGARTKNKDDNTLGGITAPLACGSFHLHADAGGHGCRLPQALNVPE